MFKIFGMINTMFFIVIHVMFFILFLFLFYRYSYAYELELSSYVIHLAYRTLYLIFHKYMFRPRPKLR
jgi:hypothetical protein